MRIHSFYSRASNLNPHHQQLSSAHSFLIAKPSLATLLLLIWKKSFTSWQVVGNPIISVRFYIGPGWLFGVSGPSVVWWLVDGYFFFQNRTTIRMDLDRDPSTDCPACSWYWNPQERGPWKDTRPWKVRWNLKIIQLKRKNVFQTSIFGLCIHFLGCTMERGQDCSKSIYQEGAGCKCFSEFARFSPHQGELRKSFWKTILFGSFFSSCSSSWPTMPSKKRRNGLTSLDFFFLSKESITSTFGVKRMDQTLRSSRNLSTTNLLRFD